MFALIAVIYFAVVGILSWNSVPAHWVALLFVGLAILSAHFVIAWSPWAPRGVVPPPA